MTKEIDESAYGLYTLLNNDDAYINFYSKIIIPRAVDM